MAISLMLLRWLSVWAADVAALVCAVRAGREKTDAAHDVKHGAQRSRRAPAAQPLPLQWRTPWWAWQLLSAVLATLLAPSFWVVGILLLIDARSDHPLFWPSLMAIVATTNAIAIVRINQLHHRRPFTGRIPLALRHFGVSMLTSCTLFMLLGWGTGFLQDVVGPMTGAPRTVTPVATMVLWNAAMALGFGMLSFPHAGLLHAWLAFDGGMKTCGPGPRQPPSDQRARARRSASLEGDGLA